VSHDNLIDKNASQTNIWNRWNFHYLSQFSWFPRADNPKENTSCSECLTTYLYLSLSWLYANMVLCSLFISTKISILLLVC